MFELPDHVQQKVRQTVLITGSARSGTSIFGKLIGSLETVEFFFEPPTLFSLFSVLETVPEASARFLFDTFVYEELLIGALSGRAINLRSQDDSSIYQTKSPEEIAGRLEGSARKHELATDGSTIAIKVPDFVYRLPQITRILKLHRVLVSIRDPESTLNSLLQRGWFSDRSLAAGDIMWPNRFDTRIPAPHWVPESFLCEWDDMAETDRAALYYITQTTLTEVPDGDALVFDYNQLVSQPRDLIEAVAEHLGLAFGRRTQPLLDGVSFQESYAKADLTGLREDIRRQVVESYEASKRRCIRL